ncbi:putative homing endonuclease [Campylobacter phage F367]|uniref:Putative homing endonuclease n=2 Tax=Fletchervirus CPX TaxID=1110702 RepID=A0A7T3KGM3_9CAUD|nr:putative homing endonuclease [Campylobacter phage F367]QPX64912.1 putative homing endonuclease [Campylobacter phage F368]
MDKIKFLNNLGYKVVSEDLVRNLYVKCKDNHIFKREFGDFKKGYIKCPKCEEKQKLEFIKGLGYEVVTMDEKGKLLLKCRNGHIIKKYFGNFKKGTTTCNECIKEEKIKFIKSCGYEPASENLAHDLFIKCKNGHIFKREYNDLKKGYINCPKCNEEDKVKLITSFGYTIINQYNSEELELMCKNGHISKRIFNNFKKFPLCSECVEDKRTSFIKELGYKVVGKNLFECKNGHTFSREVKSFRKGCVYCPICNPSISSFEKEMSELLGNYISNDYSVLGDKELDFYVPNHKLAIECNGDYYWHSEQMGKDKNYHLDKTNKCLEKGIQLLHIFESSWIEKKDIWKSIINNKLGKSNKIMARKCILKQVSKAEEKEFLESNHLQGFTGSTVCYGLYYRDELVCLMSFGKPRFTDKYNWELIRLCTKKNTNVIGGASKLLKHFEKENEGSLISYSDRLYSDGSIYKQLGFEFSHFSKPGYFYYKNGTKYSRQQFMKHKLKDKLEKFDPNLTESENMRLNGYHKVWDCGQGVWIKNRKGILCHQ